MSNRNPNAVHWAIPPAQKPKIVEQWLGKKIGSKGKTIGHNEVPACGPGTTTIRIADPVPKTAPSFVIGQWASTGKTLANVSLGFSGNSSGEPHSGQMLPAGPDTA
jgi:hypothetical protein